jgi:hypothetical protein
MCCLSLSLFFSQTYIVESVGGGEVLDFLLFGRVCLAEERRNEEKCLFRITQTFGLSPSPSPNEQGKHGAVTALTKIEAKCPVRGFPESAMQISMYSVTFNYQSTLGWEKNGRLALQNRI